LNNKTVKKFELDPKSVKVKELLNKDFLELEIKAISTANPNRNGSTFSKEALEKAIPTFYNKPILGSFSVSQDDFRAHEGDLSYDEDYEQLYYDYTDEASEIPLGLIRGDDTIKIVHSKKDGLDWLVFTCAIWVKYNYKQVKKLLKSKDGHKKISVEVEVTSSEFDEEGIEHINDFVFDGVTILGDKYETGIANAEMTILDMVDNALFQKKQKCLAFAYNELDKQNVETPVEAAAPEKDSNIKFNKEETPNENEEQPQVKMEDEKGNQEGGNAMPEEKDIKQEESCETCEICEKQEEACDDKAELSCDEKVAEACEDKEVEACGDKQEEACGDKESEACGEAKFDHDEGDKPKCIQCTIHDLMIDEHEAIEGYRHAIAHFGEEFPDIVKVFEDIMHEELEHLGELEQCLAALDPEVEEEIAEGKVEAMETIIEANYGEEGEGNPGEQEFAKDEDKDTSVDEDPEQKPEEEKPVDEPENVEAPKDNKGDDANDFAEEDPKEEEPEDDDKDDDDDKDEDDDKEDDDSENDEPDDEEDKEDDFGCGKESDFSNTLDPNAEPINVDVDGIPMGDIIEESTQSIKAPEVMIDVENMGDANKEVASVLPDVQQEVVNGDPDGTANEDGSPINPAVGIVQPDDAQKEQDKHFVSEAEISDINVAELLKKYNELEEKFNQLNDAAKAQEAEKLIKFGTDFINADEVVDEESKQNFVSQLEEKCKAFEFETEEDVTKFAKGLMAMYYYEHQAVKKETNNADFSVALNRPTHNGNNASNAKLKDAINKLNYLNKEE